MSMGEYQQLLGEKTALARMLAETPEHDVIDRASLSSRLKVVELAIEAIRGGANGPES